MFSWSSKEKWFLIVFSVAVIIYTTGPYIFGYFKTPSDHTFAWITPLNPTDTNVYFSYLRQAAAGELEFKDFFTAEPQARGVFNVFWYTIGRLGATFHADPWTSFQVARILLIPFALVLIYIFLSLLFENVRLRMFGLVLTTFGGGFGSFLINSAMNRVSARLVPIEELPMDWLVVEGFPHLAFTNSPHFIASYLGLLGTILLLFFGTIRRRLIYTVSAGLLALIYFNFHPYYVLPITLIAIVFWLVEYLRGAARASFLLAQAGVFFILALPSPLYHLWVSWTDPIVALRNAQNITTTPTFSMVIVSYGLLLGGLAYAIYLLPRLFKLRPVIRLLVLWAIIDFLLLFSGLNMARRFTQGLTIPFTLLLIAGLEELMPRWHALWSRRPLLIAGLVGVTFFFSVFSLQLNVYRFYPQSFGSLEDIPLGASLLYLDPERAALYSWLRRKPLGSVRLMAGVTNSNSIPGQTGQITFAGHWAETVAPTEKFKLTRAFYGSNDQDDEKLAFLKHFGITHVLLSPLEQFYGNFSPQEKSYLKEVFRSGNVALYAVR